jgi:F-type H+-transporting ATPase subunit delta
VSRRIARPYAAALFQVMQRRGLEELREVETQLATVAEVFQRHDELLRVFEVPAVPQAKKHELFLTLGRELSLRVETQRMLHALVQHYRLRFLPEVVDVFRDMVDRLEGKVRGQVILPTPPEAGQIERLAVTLHEALGSRVELESRVDPDLLAGFVVRLGSKVYDGSLRTQVHKFAASASKP